MLLLGLGHNAPAGLVAGIARRCKKDVHRVVGSGTNGQVVQVAQKVPRVHVDVYYQRVGAASSAGAEKFATRFQFVQTNCLVVQAEHDIFVYNRAMAMFVQKAPNSLMFFVPDAYHETLHETDAVRGGVKKVIVDFFTQKNNTVAQLQPASPLVPHDPTKPIFSPLETALRLTGFVVGAVGCIVGASMLLSSSGNKGVIRR